MDKIDFNDLSDVVNIELLSKQIVEGFITGLHKSPFHGFSVEFAEHRLYNQGESVKNIDWKLFGRTEKLFVKRFEEETNLRCQIIIDASSSMFYPSKGLSKFKFSVMATACIIQLLKKQRDAFGLSTFTEKIEIHTQAKSTYSHQKMIFNQLESIWNLPNLNNKTLFSKNLHTLADLIHKRSLVVIFSDFICNDGEDLASLFAALQHLKYNKHEVVIFNIQESQHEINFDFDNKPYHFIDNETGDEVKLNPSLIKNQYLKSTNEYRKELLTKAAQLKLNFTLVNMDEGYKNLLNAWLIKRNTMY